MDYIVFDLEWNQCPQGKVKENPRLPFEIIEIGAIKLNENKEEIGRFHEVIRPLVYRRLHFRTKEVIPMSQEELAGARTFSPVVRDFLHWCGEDCKFVTWGSLDLNELQRNMDYYRINNPLPYPLFFYDLQKMFSLLYDDGKSRWSLEDAVKYRGIPQSRPFHRAMDDTFYTAAVMQQMDMSAVCGYESIDYHRLPQMKQEEIFQDFKTYTKYVSRPFGSKEEAMSDKTVLSLRCSRCGLPVLKRIRWFSTGANTYLALIQCPKHGYVKGKIRIKKTGDGRVFVVKTIKPADAEVVRKVKEKREQVRDRRRERRNKSRRKAER